MKSRIAQLAVWSVVLTMLVHESVSVANARHAVGQASREPTMLSHTKVNRRHIFLLIGSLLLLALAWSTASPAGVWLDEFDGEQLDARWVFNARGNPQSEVTVKDEKLYLHVPAGNNDLIPGNERAPTLTMPAPPGDYTVTTLYVGPTVSNAAAGIAIFEDGSNGMQLLFGIGGPGGQNVWFMAGVNGAVPPARDKDGNLCGAGWGSHLFTGGLGPQEKVYLRIVKRSDVYTSHYRLGDNETWEEWLHFTIPLQNPQVGLIAKNWGGGALTAEFEFFQIEGENVNFSVKPQNHLTTTWAQVKSLGRGAE